MHLSISSSNDRLPTGHWKITWLLVSILFSGFILFFEVTIRANGWTPSFNDSIDLWSYHRQRASKLGSKALILLGASRIQLGLDLAEIRTHTSLEPIQLAIDGASPVPVLENLAADPDINGVILLSLTEGHVQPDYTGDYSTHWLKYYAENYAGKNMIEPYRRINNKVKMFLESRMVTRHEGAKPVTVISSLAFRKTDLGNYLVTNQDRSRNADYSKVKMPDFYGNRVARHLGMELISESITYSKFIDRYTQAINDLKPQDNRIFLNGIEIIFDYINKIEDRGGKVIILRLPTDKLIWEIDNQSYPRKYFWDHLVNRHDKVIHFKDYPSLQAFNLPDGSHVDYRDKKLFTRELMLIINNYLTD